MNYVLFTIFLTTFSLACSTPEDQRHRSPFFDGKRFANPAPSDKSFWSFLKMRLSTEYADWPDWIDASYHVVNPARVTDGLHVTHINHSTVLLQTAGKNILTDPIFSDRCSPVSWAGPKRVRNPGVKLADLPPIDLVLISHDHYDHLDLPSLEVLIERDNPHIFVGLGVAARLEGQGRVTELDWWEKVPMAGHGELHFVPVQHFSGRTLFDRNSTLWGGYYLKLGGRSIYFGGDTGYAGHFKETREKLGSVDLAILPVGAYAPRDFMSYAHMDPDQAVKAHLDLGAKRSLAVHYGTFQLTAEEYDAPLRELQSALQQHQVDENEFLTPTFGKVLVLDLP